MSSKPDTWSRYATIFSLYYVGPLYERFVSNKKRILVFVPGLLGEDCFFRFEKVDEGKYAIKSADIEKYLVPDEDKVTLSDNKYTWIVEAVGAPDTYYTIRDSEGLGNYFTAGPDQLDPERAYIRLYGRIVKPEEFVRQLFTIKTLTARRE